MTSSVQANQSTLLSALVDCLTGDAEVFRDLIGRERAAFYFEQPFSFSKASQPRRGERIVGSQRFNRVRLLQRADKDLDVGRSRGGLRQRVDRRILDRLRDGSKGSRRSNLTRRFSQPLQDFGNLMKQLCCFGDDLGCLRQDSLCLNKAEGELVVVETGANEHQDVQFWQNNAILPEFHLV